MSESLALPSAGSQLLRHPQPHTRTCAHAHAHGAVTRARSHARPPCPSSPSPRRLQAAIRALHCGSCLQVGGASAPPPPPPAFPFCSGSLGCTEPGRRGPLRARPRAWGPRAPGCRRGQPGGPLHPPSRLGPSSSRSGHGVGGKYGRPICPGALPGGGWGRGRLRLLHARDPRTGAALPVATATLWNARHHFPRAAGRANGGRVCQQSPRSSRGTGSEEAGVSQAPEGGAQSPASLPSPTLSCLLPAPQRLRLARTRRPAPWTAAAGNAKRRHPLGKQDGLNPNAGPPSDPAVPLREAVGSRGRESPRRLAAGSREQKRPHQVSGPQNETRDDCPALKRK